MLSQGRYPEFVAQALQCRAKSIQLISTNLPLSLGGVKVEVKSRFGIFFALNIEKVV